MADKTTKLHGGSEISSNMASRVVTAMTYFSNFVASPEIGSSANNVPASQGVQSTSKIQSEEPLLNNHQAIYGNHHDLDDIQIDFSKDDFTNLNPEFSRLFDKVGGSNLGTSATTPGRVKINNYTETNAGAETSQNENRMVSNFVSTAITAPLNDSYDSDSEFQPQSKKSKMASQLSLKKTKGEISPRVSTKRSIGNRNVGVEKPKKDSGDNSILKQFLLLDKSTPTILSPIDSIERSTKVDRSKGCITLDQQPSCSRATPAIHTSAPFVNNKQSTKVNKGKGKAKITLDQQPSCSRTTPVIRDSTPVVNQQSNVFSQDNDKNILSNFMGYFDRLKREDADNLAAMGGDAKLKKNAMAMIKRGEKLLVDIEGRRVAWEKSSRKIREINKKLGIK